MSGTFQSIRRLVGSGDVRISEHGYDELAQDGLTAREIIEGVENSVLVEDYPDFPKGPSILLLQTEGPGRCFCSCGLGDSEGLGSPSRSGHRLQARSGAVGRRIQETEEMNQ